MIWKCIIGFLIWATIFYTMWRIGCWTPYYEGQARQKSYTELMKSKPFNGGTDV